MQQRRKRALRGRLRKPKTSAKKDFSASASPTPVFMKIVAAGLVVSSSAMAAKVTLVPWCDNSFRVMINPTAAQHAALLRDAGGGKPGSGAAAWAPVSDNPPGGDPGEPFAALDGAACTPGAPIALQPTPFSAINGNLEVTMDASGALQFWRKDLAPSASAPLFQATAAPFARSATSGFLTAGLSLAANATGERIFGLGQGNWTSYSPKTGCASGGPERVVPLERNGQTVGLQQQKFHVTIPFAYSTAGYGFLWNMPGAGRVDVGRAGVGGMEWTAEATTGLDFWVTGPPPGAPTLSGGSGSSSTGAGTGAGAGADSGGKAKGGGGKTTKAVAMAAVYKTYADATGHAPPLREDAMIFWQSRNRYKSADIVLAVCDRYKALDLPVGVIVVDYKNQDFDGDFAPNPDCYPSVKALADGVKEKLNATMTFSFWPEAKRQSAEYGLLNRSGCLINSDLGGNAIDPTTKACRDLIWEQFLKPRYYDQGVSAYWLDETDGEGTAGGDGEHGYDTSYGPAVAYSNLWVNDWLKTFTDPVAALAVPGQPPMALTRGVWAGGQKHGVVLWSSDIESTFEELRAQVLTTCFLRLPLTRDSLPTRFHSHFSTCPARADQPRRARVALRHPVVDERRGRLRLRQRAAQRLAVHAGAHRALVPVRPLLPRVPHARLPCGRRPRPERGQVPAGAEVVRPQRDLELQQQRDAGHAGQLHHDARGEGQAVHRGARRGGHGERRAHDAAAVVELPRRRGQLRARRPVHAGRRAARGARDAPGRAQPPGVLPAGAVEALVHGRHRDGPREPGDRRADRALPRVHAHPREVRSKLPDKCCYLVTRSRLSRAGCCLLRALSRLRFLKS